MDICHHHLTQIIDRMKDADIVVGEKAPSEVRYDYRQDIQLGKKNRSFV